MYTMHDITPKNYGTVLLTGRVGLPRFDAGHLFIPYFLGG